MKKLLCSLSRIKKASTYQRVSANLVVLLVLASAVSAVLITSHVMTLHAEQGAVTLVEIKDISSPVINGQKASFKFGVQTKQQVTDATLWLQVRVDGIELNNPNIVQISYKHSNEEAFNFVSLTAKDGKLKGPLKSDWTIPAAYDGTVEVLVLFLSDGEPAAPYSVDLWAEGALDSPTASPPFSRTRTFQ